MTKKKNTNVKPSAAFFVVLSVLGRLLPHLPNMTPLGGTAIFGGKNIARPWNYLLPLGLLFLTDLFLGFHDAMIYVYISFAMTVFLSEQVKSSRPLVLGGLAISSSVIFFLITNFGVWANGWYPHTLAGLILSYEMGLPFLRNMLIGDLAFTGAFFTIYELANRAEITKTFDNKILGWIN